MRRLKKEEKILICKRIFFGCAWELTMSILLLQRMIFVLCLGVILIPFWLVYVGFRWHRPLLEMSKACCRFFLWINGIRVHVNQSVFKTLERNIVWCSYFSPIDYLILFSIMPYKTVQYLPMNFIQYGFFRFFCDALGIFEEEAHFDYGSYQKKVFHADDYAEAGFNLVQAVHVKRQKTEQIPYALMIGLKHQFPILFCRLHGSERTIFASFLSPESVHLKVHERVSPSKKVEVTLIRYRKILEELTLFERSKRTLISRK